MNNWDMPNIALIDSSVDKNLDSEDLELSNKGGLEAMNNCETEIQIEKSPQEIGGIFLREKEEEALEEVKKALGSELEGRYWMQLFNYTSYVPTAMFAFEKFSGATTLSEKIVVLGAVGLFSKIAKYLIRQNKLKIEKIEGDLAQLL